MWVLVPKKGSVPDPLDPCLIGPRGPNSYHIIKDRKKVKEKV
jgi:hypothetical protein